MTIGSIAIKGNLLDQQNQIFEALNYIDLQQDLTFDNWDQTITFLDDNYFTESENEIAIRGFGQNTDWTIIVDPEMVDMLETESLRDLSRQLNSVIFTFIIQTTSNSFGFTKYDGEIVRDFFSTDGNITENSGTPLIEESGLNFNEQVFADDIIGLAAKVGIDLQNPIERPFIVKKLGYNEVMKAKLAQYSTQQQPDSGKPWWKIW